MELKTGVTVYVTCSSLSLRLVSVSSIGLAVPLALNPPTNPDDAAAVQEKEVPVRSAVASISVVSPGHISNEKDALVITGAGFSVTFGEMAAESNAIPLSSNIELSSVAWKLSSSTPVG